ncbi:MAG: AMP-binding protein, partial [bacterium]|nr:AMP-binding protein [bacterium]
VLKSGGAYLPIDPDYPEDRINYMLSDSKAKVMLTIPASNREEKNKNKIAATCDQWNGEVIFIDDDDPETRTPALQPLPHPAKPNNLAYVIYTSGTTGNPKGAMIEHRNVVRLLFNDGFLFDFSSNDTWSLFHSYCFDFSVWEIFGALLYGGRLVVVPRTVAKDQEKYLELLLDGSKELGLFKDQNGESISLCDMIGPYTETEHEKVIN